MIREQYIHVLTSHSSKYNISEFFVNFYWSPFALQYCVSFNHTTKRISYVYTYTPSVWIFFPFSSPWSNEFPVLYSWFSVILLCVCTHTHAHTRLVMLTLQPHSLQPARLLCPWEFPSKHTGVGCYLLLQGIFPTEESKLLHFVRFREKSLRKSPDLTPPPANQSEPLASLGNSSQARERRTNQNSTPNPSPEGDQSDPETPVF